MYTNLNSTSKYCNQPQRRFSGEIFTFEGGFMTLQSL